MKSRDIVDLLLLGALWGASFLFLRVAAPEFGPIPLIEIRVGVGALVLLPLLAARDELATLKQGWKPVWIMGVFNSALPFCLFAFAALSISGGLAAILNSSSPLWGALFLHEWPSWRELGGCAVILLGTAFAIGMARLPPRIVAGGGGGR